MKLIIYKSCLLARGWRHILLHHWIKFLLDQLLTNLETFSFLPHLALDLESMYHHSREIIS